MRLPKWVVKWVKDDFDFERLELKVKQQEEEIATLKRTIVRLKRDALPQDEKDCALRVYVMMDWPLFWDEWNIFQERYIEERDEDMARRGLSCLFPI